MRQSIVLGLTGFLLFATSWALVQDSTPGSGERAIFTWANGLPDFLRLPLWMPMQLGGSYAFIGLGIVAYLIRQSTATALVVAGTGVVAQIFAGLTKGAADRPRPGSLLDDVALRGEVHDGLGYPSGHTSVGVAFAVLFFALLPAGWRWSAVIVAALVAFARLYFGAHLPLDLLGGAGIGLIVGSAGRSLLIAIGPLTDARARRAS